jgi:hypothetical protein
MQNLIDRISRETLVQYGEKGITFSQPPRITIEEPSSPMLVDGQPTLGLAVGKATDFETLKKPKLRIIDIVSRAGGISPDEVSAVKEELLANYLAYKEALIPYLERGVDIIISPSVLARIDETELELALRITLAHEFWHTLEYRSGFEDIEIFEGTADYASRSLIFGKFENDPWRDHGSVDWDIITMNFTYLVPTSAVYGIVNHLENPFQAILIPENRRKIRKLCLGMQETYLEGVLRI